MRKRIRWLAGAVIVLVGLWVVLFPRTDAAPPDAASRTSSTPGASSPWNAAKHAVPVPTGSLRITGVARDARGPVSGVRVTATRVDAETLSEQPCPEALRGGTKRSAVRLTACGGAEMEAEVARRVEVREGEAPVFAETVSAEDGTFALEGLSEGAFTLWALGEHGAVLRPEVPAGSADVELALEEGVRISGTVAERVDGTPIPGARVTVVHEDHTRFFDVIADEQGRFYVGPLPPGRYLEVASAQGWRTGVFREDVWLDADVDVDLELHPLRRFEGRVFTPQGLPAAGLTVNLRSIVQGSELRTTRTDAQGHFTFEDVPDIEYHLWVWTPERTAFGETPTLRPQEKTFIRMEPCSSMEGTVRDEQGHPLEGVRLAVTGQNLGDAPPQEAFTDAAGHYRLGPLLASALDLHITHHHFTNRQEAIPRREGSARTWDFTLTRAVSVEGRVVDTEGNPIEGAALRLFFEDEAGSSLLRASVDRTQDEDVLSDEAGRFVIDTAQQGSGWIIARASDFTSTKVAVKLPSTEVRVVLQRGASVTGSVVDAKGRPMTDVTLKLWDTAPASGAPRTGSVDREGGFSLRGLKAGHYVLEASLRTPGLEQSTSQPVELEEHTQAEVALRFEEGRTLEGLTVDTGGRPLPGVQVQACLPLDDVPAWQLTVEPCDPRRGGAGGVRSGPDGRFVFKHLVAPTYQLVAWKEGHAFVPARSRGGIADASSRLVTPGDEGVHLVLERRPRLKARVVSADGKPLRSSLLAWFHESTSPPDGVFDIALQDDIDHVYVNAEGYFELFRNVAMKPGGDVDLGTLVMTRARKTRILVRDEANPGSLAGVPVSVFLSDESNPLSYEGRVPRPFNGNLDEEGAVELPDLPFAPIVLTVKLRQDSRSQDVALDAHQELATVTVPARPR
ncbi:MAG: carboxypeptidase regulatory-like domain-containing protein [Myxococcaceae bacterium]|nr:MAG: carboxypeptidase regulatory-like domain-containing protein [Myxococcaceae bacterium]